MIVAKNRADRVMLYDISWQQFENLLKDLGHWAAKLACDRTTLEIIRPLPDTQRLPLQRDNRLIGELKKSSRRRQKSEPSDNSNEQADHTNLNLEDFDYA